MKIYFLTILTPLLFFGSIVGAPVLAETSTIGSDVHTRLSPVQQQELDTDLDAFIQKYSINLTGDDIPPSVTREDALRMKAFATIANHRFAREEADTSNLITIDNSSHSTNKTDKGTLIGYERYKDFIFLYFPLKSQYSILVVDADTFRNITPEIPSRFSGDGVFFKDKNYIYSLSGTDLFTVPGIDSATFEVYQSSEYWNIELFKDANHLYFMGKDGFRMIDGADPKTFEKEFEPTRVFYRDRMRVYYYNEKRDTFSAVEGADPSTFVHVVRDRYSPLSFEYYHDKAHAFFFNEKSGDWKPIQQLNPNTEEFIFGGILKRNNGIFYFNSTTPTPVKVAGVYIKSFGMYPDTYGMLFKDSRYIYAYNPFKRSLEQLKGVDGRSFVIVNRTLGGPYPHLSFLFKDKNGVYTTDIANTTFSVKKIQGADPKYFTVIYDSQLIVAKDLKKVFAGSNVLQEIKGADPRTFKIIQALGIAYAKDKNHVYYADPQKLATQVLKDADPATFSVMRVGWYYYYAKDKKHVWFYDNTTHTVKLISGIDPKTFKPDEHARQYYH